MKARILLIASMLLLLLPVQAWACACCADEGEYRISFRKPNAYELGLLQEMRFGPRAHLFETPDSTAEDVFPAGAQTDGYSVTALLTAGVWKLNFRDANRTGTLSLPLPANMLNYAVDTHDGQTSGGGGPRLYKEWRFKGRVTPAGFFRSGKGSPTNYFLVLQGRGNRCDNAEDFSHWRLELDGPRVRYALYGELVRPVALLHPKIRCGNARPEPTAPNFFTPQAFHNLAQGKTLGGETSPDLTLKALDSVRHNPLQKVIEPFPGVHLL